MKKGIIFVGSFIFLVMLISGTTQEKNPQAKNFYENSLHYTNRGLEYWYSKEQGGLERLTGIPISELDCSRCHVRSCDTCHRKDENGKSSYSLEPAQAQQVCQDCHGIESLEKARKDKNDPGADVHFKSGMNCLDCHTPREIHGDGTPYNSIQQPGALEVRCEKCHGSQVKCLNPDVHGSKVDCNACHVRDLPSCYNCHFDTRVKEKKSVSLPLQNMFFLVNHEGRVTLANLHTFVYQNKAMITFAPSFSHAIMKEGRKCEECHATPITEDIQKNQFYPVVYEKGEVKNVQGVIPVLEGMDWNFVYLNYENDRWVPIENPAKPLINFSGYCQPLTAEQFRKLGKAPASGKNP